MVVPNARLGLQMGDKGTAQPGAPAILGDIKDGEEQRWRLEEGKRWRALAGRSELNHDTR